MEGRAGLVSVLVIKLGALGDLMQSLDAFQAIRAHHPGERLALLTMPAFAGFASAMPWFDEVWTDSRPKLWQPLALWRLIRTLRGAGLSRVYDLQSNQRTGLYFKLLAGRRPEWSGAAPGCSHPRPEFRSLTGHNHDRLLAHLASAGVPAAGPADLSWLDAEVSGFELPQPFVLLMPGCSPHRPYKRWPPECFAALALRLAARGLTAVAIGTGADRDAVAAIRARAPAVVDLTGRTSLAELAGLARRAAGVVGNDTGPLFVASMVGAPTLMLMSRHTDPERMAPLGPVTAWLRRDALADLGVGEVEAAMRLRPEIAADI
jgi:ADP-heptose:LPS heptosyltransferase